MNRNRNVIIVSIVIAIFVFSSVSFLVIAVNARPSSRRISSSTQMVTRTNIEEITSDESKEKGFYDDIGQIYDAKADDNLIVKVLRYHAPGKGFNYGTQPVLFFPGLGCNINQFLAYSTPDMKEKYDITLPANLADWAVGDKNIENDPMLYYSIAYYLWSQGYDPWFGNYRGIGYGPMKSEGGDGATSMDQFALYDVKAAVKKIYEVTGLHPFIGGHSTGGLVCIMYLQGTYFRWDGHIRSSDALVKERNGITKGPQTVAGMIGIDPAMIPIVPNILDNILIWALLKTDIVLDAGGLLNTLMGIELIDEIFQGLISLIADGESLGETLLDFLKNTVNLDINNVNEEILYFFFKYCVSTMYFRTLSQYLDFYVNQCVREFWQNGWFNNLGTVPPAPHWLDGYYYYTDNMDKIQVPLICFLADGEGDLLDFVDADQIMKDLVNGKTQTVNDECYTVPAAHIDIGFGINNPKTMHPKLGNWLAEI